ncbi:helix-turn-helix domain-containing protein [Subtercola lobariae]|nr:helix-turn-helix transcriptional regulator [Subtercola lobariae]
MTGSEAPMPIRFRTPAALEPLWRQLLGHQLRVLRLANGEKLAETAARAGISAQYLSEIERGLKEPSSEMIAAIAGALGVTLLDLTVLLTNELRGARSLESSHELSRRDGTGGRASTQLSDSGSTLVLAFAA